jgi:hypothetical protein
MFHTKSDKLAAAAATIVITAGGITIAATTEPAHSSPNNLPAWVTRPCKQEDSYNCRWIATTPKGHNFIVRKLPHSNKYCVFYIKKQDARRWDYCDTDK